MSLLDDELNIDTEVHFPKPSLIARLKSSLLDTMVIVLLMYMSSLLLEAAGIISGQVRMVLMIGIILYEPIMVVLGGTVGQRILGIKVVKSSKYKNDGTVQNINILSSIMRYFFKLTLGWISLLTIHSSIYGQAIHDKVGNSIMTYR